MPTYSTAGTSKTLQTDMGTPSLAAGDAVYIGRGSLDYDNAGSNDMSATDLLLVELLSGWRGNFPESAPLKLVANRSNAGRVKIRWGGQRMYLRSISMAAGVIYGIEQDPAAGGTVMLSEVDCETYTVRGGVLHALASADINKGYTSGFGLAHFYASGPTMAEARAGGSSTLNLHRDAALAGAYENGTLNINEVAVTIATLDLAGRVNHRGGNVGDVNLLGGIWDLTEVPFPITVTNRNAYLPTTILLKVGQPEPTWTNKPVDVNPPIIKYV
jgi:hypothetical protein